jgi:arabinofuranan 3-O-arabinosyltransferase
MTTDTLTVQFVKVARRIGHVPANGTRFVLPVGVARLRIPAIGPVTATPAADRAFDLPCGSGPSVRLDGHVLPTQVEGTLSELENLQPMGLAVCNGPTAIAQGGHVLQAGRLNGAFKVTMLQALPATAPAAATTATATTTATPAAAATTTAATAATTVTASAPASTPAGRSTRIIGSWGAASRTIAVGPGAESYLAVAQNYNTGWKAVLNGRSLTPIRIDGWQQAWVVPAGAGGTVVMTYPADSWYRMALLIGAFFVAALAAFALVRRGRRGQPAAPERKPLPRILVAAGCFVVLAIVSGPLALGFIPLVYAGRRWGRRTLAAIAGCAFLVAGAAVAAIPGAEPPRGVGAFGWPAQLFTAIALGALLASLLLPEKDAEPSPPDGLQARKAPER